VGAAGGAGGRDRGGGGARELGIGGAGERGDPLREAGFERGATGGGFFPVGRGGGGRATGG